ncbi:MAG TPA: MotA/TolQ/ExbB proton channel family protein [Verrucomicrobiales bacterium]|nr:MotA/TolQ/ExbB proton channel family protein [Verrucomicrobiales bacterium]
MIFTSGSALRRALPLLTLIAVGILFAPSLWAQDQPIPKRTILDMIKEGGWAMIPLGLCSLAMLALIIYNFLQLTQGKFAPAELKAALLEHMSHVRVRSAIEVSSTSPSFLGRMMSVALPKVDATDAETLGREAVEDSMADFTLRENRNYMSMIGYLSLIAQASPMLGLLGTVSGMIGAFSTLRDVKAPDATQLAGNISEALVTTATGLIIALPCLFFYFFFRNRLNRLVADCHNAGSEMIDASLAAVHADTQLAKVPEGLAG